MEQFLFVIQFFYLVHVFVYAMYLKYLCDHDTERLIPLLLFLLPCTYTVRHVVFISSTLIIVPVKPPCLPMLQLVKALSSNGNTHFTSK